MKLKLLIFNKFFNDHVQFVKHKGPIWNKVAPQINQNNTDTIGNILCNSRLISEPEEIQIDARIRQ